MYNTLFIFFMHSTIVIQSHRQPLPNHWLQTCLDSVVNWSKLNSYDYQFFGDELFGYLSAEILTKTKSQPVIATDLARLKVLQEYLYKDYETVVWCDADFIIFSPNKFKLSKEAYAVGREVWIQEDNNDQNKLVVNTKVHNAFMMFKKDNTFLDFYTETAERLVMNNSGNMSPQYIGPKLLTAIHNVVQCPVLETAGMLSPLVVKDIAAGGGRALDLYNQKSLHPIHAANVCTSLYERGDYTEKEIEWCLDFLLSSQTL